MNVLIFWIERGFAPINFNADLDLLVINHGINSYGTEATITGLVAAHGKCMHPTVAVVAALSKTSGFCPRGQWLFPALREQNVDAAQPLCCMNQKCWRAETLNI
jgi:hypothetical protein